MTIHDFEAPYRVTPYEARNIVEIEGGDGEGGIVELYCTFDEAKELLKKLAEAVK